jgi:23S rRNA (adenine2503-C2)-methyltransferase
VEALAGDLRLEPANVNLVFMGMGEPLHNYDGVLGAIRVLTDPGGTGVPLRRVTVSTVGLVPEIERLASEPRPPRLAVSLNATTDELRREMMPVGRRYPLERLLAATSRFGRDRRHRITFEYVMLAEVNDGLDDARRLVGLLHGQRARVNLIPFNPTPRLPYRRSPAARVDAFRRHLVERGLRATVRRSRGRDVEAACGQLAFGSGAAGPRPGRSR